MSQLARQVALPGAVLLGLGSMLGTGVYASLGLAIPQASYMWQFALFLATITALCNGLSSARLATRFPVSGGTYTYGYELVHPIIGFSAGWLFLIAKSASAAAACLACAHLLPFGQPLIIGIVLLIALAAAANSGLKRSNRLNAVLVGLALAGLVAFLVWAKGNPVELPAADPEAGPPDPKRIFGAAALLFVAFTGYGRVATMGEEIQDPGRNIPRAVIATILATALLYSAVGGAAAGRFFEASVADGADANSLTLQSISAAGGAPQWVRIVLGVGAVAALIGVAFNLILGLSRVVLAMARRKDLPSRLAVIDEAKNNPTRATWAVAILACLFLVAGLRFAWEISAGAVLVYYGLANVCALKLPDPPKFTKPVALVGLASCFHLAAHVPIKALLVVLGILIVGFILRGIVRPPDEPTFEE